MSHKKKSEFIPKDRTLFWRRIASFSILIVFLSGGYFIVSIIRWSGSNEMHTILEVTASMIAFSVSLLALIRFYSRRTNLFLFLGTGFFWTAVLDMFHAIVTSDVFTISNAQLTSLKVWSWNLSRFYLAFMLLIMWIMWRRVRYGGAKPLQNVGVVHVLSGLVTALFMYLSTVIPYPEHLFKVFNGRPLQLIIAIFFIIPLVGYVKSQYWRRKHFYFWMIMAFIVSVFSQVFMFTSTSFHDVYFDMAHITKIVSYLFIMIGILISVYFLFIEVEQSRRKLAKQYKVIKDSNSRIEKILKKETEALSRIEKLNKFMTGRELKMVELKKRIKELEDTKNK